MSDRLCPRCDQPVASHQTLCPSCRAPVPTEAGPVARDSSAFSFSAPPPRQTRPEPGPPPAGAPSGDATAPSGSVEGAPGAPWHAAPGPPAAAEPGTEGPFVIPGTWSPDPEADQQPPSAASQHPAAAAGPVPAPEQGQGFGEPSAYPAPASAGTLGRPDAAQLDERGNLPGGLVALVGALVVTVGVFQPWITVGGTGVSGWAASVDAKVMLGLAAAATVLAALLIAGGRGLILRLAMLGLGVAVVAIGVVDVVSAADVTGSDGDPARGLYLVLAGGVLLTASGLLIRHRRFR